jgi:hypothetical protein
VLKGNQIIEKLQVRPAPPRLLHCWRCLPACWAATHGPASFPSSVIPVLAPTTLTSVRAHPHPLRLQSDLRLSRDKLKRKQAIIVRQEEEVSGRETALAAAQRDVQQLQVGGLAQERGSALMAAASQARQEEGAHPARHGHRRVRP